MPEFLRTRVTTGGFIPHGHCYLWKPGLVWLHVVSDSLIALAYYSIPFLLVYFVRKRQDLPFNWILVRFRPTQWKSATSIKMVLKSGLI